VISSSQFLFWTPFISPQLIDSGGAKGGGKPAGARAPAVKPRAPAVPRQLSYDDVDYKKLKLSCRR